jgi:hypothetical protein
VQAREHGCRDHNKFCRTNLDSNIKHYGRPREIRGSHDQIEFQISIVAFCSACVAVSDPGCACVLLAFCYSQHSQAWDLLGCVTAGSRMHCTAYLTARPPKPAEYQILLRAVESRSTSITCIQIQSTSPHFDVSRSCCFATDLVRFRDIPECVARDPALSALPARLRHTPSRVLTWKYLCWFHRTFLPFLPVHLFNGLANAIIF